MNDNELRGLVLKALYDVRHEMDMPGIPANVPALQGLDTRVLGNILRQLREKQLVDFTNLAGGDQFIGRGKITAYGVDVVEGTTAPPISISIDNSVTDSSVKVSGSQNVQVGGSGNTQTVTMDVEKLISIVDSTKARVVEKEEAKSLLKKLSENKLVQSVLANWIKSKIGGAV